MEQARHRPFVRRSIRGTAGDRSHAFRVLRDERGLSLIEVVIASAISLVVVGALLATLGSGSRTTSATQANAAGLQSLRSAIDRASTDIRQATGVNPASTSSRLDIQTLAGGLPKRMVFDVSGASFTRTVCPDANFDFGSPCGGVGAELSAVSSANAFCYDPPTCTASAPPPAMTLLRITVAGARVSASNDPLALAADVQLRNL